MSEDLDWLREQFESFGYATMSEFSTSRQMDEDYETDISRGISIINEAEKKIRTLNALEAAGVDNWDGYDIAMESLG